MKAWVKVVLGGLAGIGLGVGAACLGKKHSDDDGYVTHEIETDDYDSDSDDEAE